MLVLGCCATLFPFPILVDPPPTQCSGCQRQVWDKNDRLPHLAKSMVLSRTETFSYLGIIFQKGCSAPEEAQRGWKEQWLRAGSSASGLVTVQVCIFESPINFSGFQLLMCEGGPRAPTPPPSWGTVGLNMMMFYKQGNILQMRQWSNTIRGLSGKVMALCKLLSAMPRTARALYI